MGHRKTMVKTTGLRAASVALVAVLATAGCSSRGVIVSLEPESLRLTRGPAAAFLSLAVDSGAVYAVYADPATATLNLVTVPQGPHLPSTAPDAQIIDKVDVAPPLAPFFGEHVLCAEHGTVGVLYLDRETDTKNVLKLAWQTPPSTQWDLDVLEPSGDPLSLEPDGTGGFREAWTSGTVSYRGANGQVSLPTPAIPLRLLGRPGQTGAGSGFTAYDSLASVLLSFLWNGTGFDTQVVPGATPVQASWRSAAGRIDVLSWDSSGKRLVLHQQQGTPAAFSTQTVTVCEGTSTVALLPAAGDSSFLFLFDEIRSLGAGRFESQVSVIGPGGMLGSGGSRYRKGVLTHGRAKIDGFAAARTEDSLYVLVSQGDLRLLRVPLHR
jgi:hypothetical protein